jgi:hypothetical protein
MPHADPHKSFDAAVRHLFRHLTDAPELRRNPLVRDFTKTHKTTNDNELVAAINDSILRLAKPCCAEYAAAGLQLQARRRHAIILAVCAGESSSITAARLNISPRQYYRERQVICVRVAALLVSQRERPDPQVQVSDPAAVLVSRAAFLIDQGLAKTAALLLDQAWSGMSQRDRVKARICLTDALINSGDLTRAARLLRYTHAEIGTSAGATIEWLDRVALVEAKYNFASGCDAAGGAALEELARSQVGHNRTDEVSLETLIELGYWHCSNARFAQGRKALHRARLVAEHLAYVLPNQRVALALLYAYCAEDIIDDYNGSHRRFRNCLEVSVANASMRGTVEATIGLMGYFASAGCDDAVIDWAKRALDIARNSEGDRYLVFVSAWIGTTLLKTRYWRAVDPLIFEAEAIAKPGTLHWVFLKEAQADFLGRTARYKAAEESFAAADEATKTLQNPKWQAILCRDRGLMLGSIGSEESIRLMTRAVELAEAGAMGAWSRSLTYQAASKVLHPGRIARPAPRMMEPCLEPRADMRRPMLTLKGAPPARLRQHHILP